MRKRDIIGTEVAITDYEEVLDAIDAAVASRGRTFICCAPASSLVFARSNASLRLAYENAAFVTPDGSGVVLAARMLGERIHGRVYGPDLMRAHCQRAERSGHRVWLLGGHDEETLERLKTELAIQYPKLNVVGGFSPPHRQLSASERAALIGAINADQPDVVWVGLGSPKQEIWMNEYRESLEPPVLCGVGAAFDFISGRVNQAPGWVRRAGFEWFHRMFSDPRRLVRRYLSTLPRFLLLVVQQRQRESSHESS